MPTRVKICGMTRLADALDAIELGADALGFVFYEPSPRSVTIDQAASIANHLPPFVTRVGLFVDAKADFIESVLQHVELDLLQFHGKETVAECERFSKPYIKAIRVKDDQTVKEALAQFTSAKALLLDTYKPGVPGGTGATFDWQLIPAKINKPIILAGGLTATNVAEAINTVKPYGVDVSGGVEASKGIKNKQLMAAFIKEVKR